ncbi:RDD family protein [Bacteroides sp. 224]|uniref:RDD family protein n=1 Tax=Bacteroides sp. 224 TaxID=2302936 RepID=UPI0013D1B7F9|nr:RDD family protein [Bacteroides sp. 224]NDV66454.1 RDD family protein [Bacteroides sp. 224]
MATSTIITGQFVRINQVSASLGDRLIAKFIDYVILFLYLISTIYIVSLFRLTSFSDVTMIVWAIIIYVPWICYSLLFEVFNQGQSPGKMLLNIRVVKADGSTPTFSSYLLRWLLYIVDVPLTGGLGLLVILLSKNNQRLGDLAAGTLVIKEKNYKKIQVNLDEYDYLTDSYRPTFPQAADLSLEQVNVISKTLDAPPGKRWQMLQLLSKKIKEVLGIHSTELNDEQFLQTLIRDYQYYALEII